jgi:hypothetical protein
MEKGQQIKNMLQFSLEENDIGGEFDKEPDKSGLLTSLGHLEDESLYSENQTFNLDFKHLSGIQKH